MNWSNEVNKKIIDMFADELENKKKNNELIQLISEYKPNSLFKFKDFRDGYEETILNGENFSLSNRLCFEDELDCNLDIDLPEEEIFKFVDERESRDKRRKFYKNKKSVKKYIYRVREMAKEHVWNTTKEFYIGCLAAPENISSIYMWEKYTKNKGYCLEYNYDELFEIFKMGIFPMYYTDEKITVPVKYKPNHGLRDSFKIDIGKFTVSFFKKTKKWEFEHEWRVYVENHSVDDKVINKDEGKVTILKKVCSPKAVYFGSNISEFINKPDENGFVLTTKNFEKLIHDCKQNNIKVYQMYMENEKLFYFEI